MSETSAPAYAALVEEQVTVGPDPDECHVTSYRIKGPWRSTREEAERDAQTLIASTTEHTPSTATVDPVSRERAQQLLNGPEIVGASTREDRVFVALADAAASGAARERRIVAMLENLLPAPNAGASTPGCGDCGAVGTALDSFGECVDHEACHQRQQQQTVLHSDAPTPRADTHRRTVLEPAIDERTVRILSFKPMPCPECGGNVRMLDACGGTRRNWYGGELIDMPIPPRTLTPGCETCGERFYRPDDSEVADTAALAFYRGRKLGREEAERTTGGSGACTCTCVRCAPVEHCRGGEDSLGYCPREASSSADSAPTPGTEDAKVDAARRGYADGEEYEHGKGCLASVDDRWQCPVRGCRMLASGPNSGYAPMPSPATCIVCNAPTERYETGHTGRTVPCCSDRCRDEWWHPKAADSSGMDDLIARSSIGTPEAVAARSRVPKDVVERVLRRADELEAREVTSLPRPSAVWEAHAWQGGEDRYMIERRTPPGTKARPTSGTTILSDVLCEVYPTEARDGRPAQTAKQNADRIVAALTPPTADSPDSSSMSYGAGCTALPLPEWSGCPCTIVEPCSRACSCASPGLSGGCRRCASYGSKEQRLATATRLAALSIGTTATRDLAVGDAVIHNFKAPETQEKEAMSEATRGAWLAAWDSLTTARQSFGEAKTHDEKLLALGDMLALAEAFKHAVSAYATNLDMTERLARRVDLDNLRVRVKRLEEAGPKGSPT